MLREASLRLQRVMQEVIVIGLLREGAGIEHLLDINAAFNWI